MRTALILQMGNAFNVKIDIIGRIQDARWLTPTASIGGTMEFVFSAPLLILSSLHLAPSPKPYNLPKSFNLPKLFSLLKTYNLPKIINKTIKGVGVVEMDHLRVLHRIAISARYI